MVVDAINVKVRDGQVANRPVYAAIGVDLEGHKDILGMWFGDGGGESAKFWMVVLTELRNRGVADVFFLVCDGLKGLPDSVNAVWPATIVQTCLIQLIRNSFRFASRKYWDQLSRDLKPIYQAVNPEAAAAALDDLDAKWDTRYPAIIRLWRNAWEEFIPFLDYDLEIRKILCSTNAIESLNARYRRAAIRDGRADLEAAESQLNGVVASRYPYPRWLGFVAPALLSMAVTIMFGGRPVDALTTLGIGLAIQARPGTDRAQRAEQLLPGGVRRLRDSATGGALVKLGLPIHGVVLTGSLLRFLPGPALVSGMHDFIDGALSSGTVRLAEVVLLGAAIAGAASLVLIFGTSLDVHLEITTARHAGWPTLVIVAAGSVAVTFYACHLGVPRRALLSAAALVGIAVLLAKNSRT